MAGGAGQFLYDQTTFLILIVLIDEKMNVDNLLANYFDADEDVTFDSSNQHGSSSNQTHKTEDVQAVMAGGRWQLYRVQGPKKGEKERKKRRKRKIQMIFGRKFSTYVYGTD